MSGLKNLTTETLNFFSQRYEEFIMNCVDRAPREVVTILDRLEPLRVFTIENIQKSLPEGWKPYQTIPPNYTQLFDFFRNKTLPVCDTPEFSYLYWTLGLIPNLYVNENFVLKLPSLPQGTAKQLYNLILDFGIIEQNDDLRFFGAKFLINPALIDMVYEGQKIVHLKQSHVPKYEPTTTPSKFFFIRSFEELNQLI